MSTRTARRYPCARIAWAFLAAALLTVLPAVAPLSAAEKAETSEAKPAAKAEAKPAEKGETPELTGEHAVMAREVNLTEKQKKQVAETVAEANEALAAWRQANLAKIESTNASLMKARQAGDREALREALADAQPLFRERHTIQQKYQKKIMDVLTDKQEVQWLGFVLWRTLTGQAKALDLTPEQSDQARALSDAAAKQLLDLPDEGEATPADARAAQTIQKDLVDQFVQEVLTDTQRETLKGRAAGGTPPPAKKSGTTEKPQKDEKAGKTAKPKG
jgi:hypothetical protein